MIFLIFNWFNFIIFAGLFRELTLLQYFFYGCCMLNLIFLHNVLFFIKLSTKTILLIFTVPNILFWYVGFVYNDFLSLTPVRYEMFMNLLLFYLYLYVYVICAQNKSVIFNVFKQNHDI